MKVTSQARLLVCGTWAGALLPLWAFSEAVLAQHVDDNAITAASDAFGTTVGSQSIGLYGQNDVRGFDPQQAGNLRIEGLYYDQQMLYTNPCVFRETFIRAGFTSQEYAFPAPSGIVDLRLPERSENAGVSLSGTVGPYDSLTTEIDFQYPSRKYQLDLAACLSLYRNFDVANARNSDDIVEGLVARWSGVPNTEATFLFGYESGRDRDLFPMLFTNGTVPPPQFQARQLTSQSWPGYQWGYLTSGLIVNYRLAQRWRLSIGAFHSADDEGPYWGNLFLSVGPTRVGDSVLDAVPSLDSGSTSGEARLTGTYQTRLLQQQVAVTARTRVVHKEFGGDDFVDVGFRSIDSTELISPPPIQYHDVGISRVQQVNVGAGYSARVKDIGWLNLGVQRIDYRRSVSEAPLSESSIAEHRWAPSVSVAAAMGSLTFFSSYARGLEDSAIAPPNATNRGDPPPATPTWQVDGGLRCALHGNGVLLLGWFQVNKAYFSLDNKNIYRQTGSVRHQGLEASFTQSVRGLTFIVGGVWVHPRLTLNEPGVSLVVKETEPLGIVPVTLNASVDIAPTDWGPWSAAVRWAYLSSRPATVTGSEELPPLSTFAISGRYRTTIAGHPLSARLDLRNATNAQGLHISSVGAIVPELGRRIAFTIAADL